MKIDLTKKPDGATHINPHSGLWVKCFGGNSGSYQFFKDGEWEMGFGCMSNSYLEIAQPEPWNGEGLPPVGAVCEYRCGYVEQPYSYAECTVIAHFVGESGKSLAAFAYVAHDGVVQLGRGMAELFRPIRTPEQVAAEDRDKAIEGMIADTNILTGIMSDRRIMAGQLYDAGYRKQASP